MTDRQCSKCQGVYPATLEYFHTEGNNRGLRKECKKCANARAKQWRDTHQEYIKAQRPKQYEKDKARSAAWRAKNQERQREYNRAYRQRKKYQQWARLMGVNSGATTV